MTGKGIRYEWAAKRELERRGNVVLRMAASHGPFDLVAFRNVPRPKTGFFQLKTYIECNAADSLLQRLPQPYGASVCVVHRCRGTCRRDGYVAQPYCMHERTWQPVVPLPVERTTLYVP